MTGTEIILHVGSFEDADTKQLFADRFDWLHAGRVVLHEEIKLDSGIMTAASIQYSGNPCTHKVNGEQQYNSASRETRQKHSLPTLP